MNLQWGDTLVEFKRTTHLQYTGTVGGYKVQITSWDGRAWRAAVWCMAGTQEEGPQSALAALWGRLEVSMGVARSMLNAGTVPLPSEDS